MQHEFTRRALSWGVRVSVLVSTAAALAACTDDAPVQPKANVPAGGPTKPSAVVHIIPEGTTFPAKIAMATGSAVGKDARVRIYDKAGKQMASFYAFSAFDDFTAGVEVALGDVNGDGFPDIIAGEGPIPNSPWWGVSQVNVWDGKTGTLISTITPFAGFKLGLRVGAADVDGDGKDEVLACTAPGVGGNRAAAFELGSNTSIYGSGSNIYTNNMPGTGGCHIAGGDLDGDGRAEMVIRFDGTANLLEIKDLKTYASRAFGIPLGWQYTGPADVAVGDVNGDGVKDIAMSFLQDSAVVRVFDGSKLANNGPLTLLKSFKPVYYWQGAGVDIAVRDVNGDGVADLLYKPMKSMPFAIYSMVGAFGGPSLTSLLLWFEEFGPVAPGGPIG